MSKRRRKKQNQTPQKAKPKKTSGDSFRKFLARNRDIIIFIGVIIAALTLFIRAYSFFSQGKLEPQPRPRFEIDRAAPTWPTIPVPFVKGE